MNSKHTLMKKIHLLLSLTALLFISACCQKQNITCGNGRLGSHVVGSFQTSTPLIIRYKQDNAFDIVVDTLVSSYVATAGTDSAYLLFRSIDSTRANAYMVTDSFGEGLVLGYDYKILFPEDTLTWSISGLNPTGATQMEMTHCGDKGPSVCTRNAVSCIVNGATVATVTYPSTGYQSFAYINLVR